MIKRRDYYVKSHCCFLLQYHLVLVTKYRHPVLIGKLEEELVAYVKKYFSNNNSNVLEVSANLDHIHILFETVPNTNLSELIRVFKSSSSRLIRSKFKDFLSNYYWKPYFWSNSYFIGTVSEVTAKIVEKYIQNQANSSHEQTKV